MASATKLIFDTTRGDGQSMDKYQVLAPLQSVITALTGTQLGQHWRHTTDGSSAWSVLKVRALQGLRIECIGVGADGNAPVFQFYGWRETGPGHHIGQATFTMAAMKASKLSGSTPLGFHTDPLAHSSVLSAFDANTDYQQCDLVTLDSNYEGAMFAVGTESEKPSYLDLSLASNQYSYIAANVSSLGSATSAGLVCVALGYKLGGRSPAEG